MIRLTAAEQFLYLFKIHKLMVADNTRTIRSAGVVSLAVMISRVLGLVREQTIAYLFGSTPVTDAFYAAFQIPNLMRDLFGEGILSKSFVTTFTATRIEDGLESAWNLANRTFTAIVIVLTVLCSVGMLFTPHLVDLIYQGSGFDLPLDSTQNFGFSSKRELTVYLTRIMFPFLLLVSLAAIAMGLLNSRGFFGIPALASSFFNISTIIISLTGFFLFPSMGWHPSTGLGIGVLIGGGFQLGIQIPTMWKTGWRFRPVFDFTDHRFKQIIALVVPSILGAATVQINVLVNGYFASVGENWLSWIKWAFRLLHLPIGIFGVAISTVALPNFARWLTENKTDKFRQSYRQSLELVLLLSIPASVGLMVMSKPICKLIYGVGKNTSHTEPIAAALFYYAIGLSAYSALKITIDGFYALKDTKTPVKVSLFTVATNIVLNYIFIFRLGLDHRALALSTSCTITLNFLLLLWLLSKRVGGLHILKPLLVLILKLGIASSVMGFMCFYSHSWFESSLGSDRLLNRLFGVFAPILFSILILVIICRILKVSVLDDLWEGLLKR